MVKNHDFSYTDHEYIHAYIHTHTPCSTLLGISKPTINSLHRFHLQNLFRGMLIGANNAHAFGLTQKKTNHNITL